MTYTLYSSTVFAGRHLPPAQVVLLLLRPFRGVHKKYLAGYVAICGFSINPKRVSPVFVAALVRAHYL
jgi:hypothetical protein